jgi:hypothetical protein
MLAGVPPNAKTSADFMEGLFDSDLVEMDQQLPGKNLSPSVLKKRIENLQDPASSHHQKR